ncbi:hypothetical protein SAMN05428952_1004115 [Nitrosomonas sp. Nm132]|nr:hypothetical protein SAMN05428952_1004115 [Nitrosomonas sp. Nm132]
MRMLLKLVMFIAASYAALLLLVFFAQSHLIYFPQTGRDIAITPAQDGLAYEVVKLATSDHETLHGWFVPAPSAAKGTILFFHGNAGNISHRMDYLLTFYRLGYSTFIFDYRGYGKSSGSPSESGTYHDASAAWRYLTEIKAIPPSRIVLFGESLGGAIAAWLAAQQKPAALVLASVLTSVPDLAAELYPFLPVRLLSRFQYRTIDYLPSITCPVLVAHSPQDEIVPFSHGQALFQAASEPKQFLALQGGHNEGFIFTRKEWAMSLDEFLITSLGAP